MTDFALIWNPETQSADMAVDGGQLAQDDGLMTAVLISLFTDRRANDDDVLPQAGADRRGWWGDAYSDDPNDRIGSRLWLLEREKLTEATALKARDIVREALDWMVRQGLVLQVDVTAEIRRPTAALVSGGLAIGVQLHRPDGPARQRYDFLWAATAQSVGALAA